MVNKVLLFAAFFITISVVAQTFSSNNINYNVIDAANFKVEVGYNTGFVGAAIIPSTVIYNNQSYQVTQIGGGAFNTCTALTSVSIPNTVVTIWGSAFKNCLGLTSVTIPNSVTTMGYGVFAGCTGLTSVSISNSLTTILGHTFYNCTSLNSVTIPSSVTVIDSSAFASCTSLTSVTIPNSVTTIRSSAFVDCTGLTSVTIPGSVTYIESYAFYGCTALTTVNCGIITPLFINANVFGNMNQNTCALNVDDASFAAYQAAPVWQNFNPINGVLSNKDVLTKTFSFYPNPSTDIINISLPDKLSLEKVTIYDLTGKVLKSTTDTMIPVSDLANGSYFVEVITGEGKATKVLIKK